MILPMKFQTFIQPYRPFPDTPVSVDQTVGHVEVSDF